MLLYVPDALDALVPLAVVWTAVLALAAPHLAQTASPTQVVRLLSAAAVSATLSLGAAAVAVMGILLARVPRIATWGRWAEAALPEPTISWLWALPLAVVVAISLLAGTRHLIDVLHQLWLAQDVCRTFEAPPMSTLADRAAHPAASREGLDAEWVVIDDDVPEAYAVPWELRIQRRWPRRRRAHQARPALPRRGRIVVSRGMLNVLTPAQQRVLLEHERAHLRCRHYLWVQLNEVAAVLNPALRHTPALVRAAAERHADLEAATRVGDATLTARAIAAAALARSAARRRSTAPAQPLQATGGNVVRRVEYLLNPPASARFGRLSAVILCVIIASAGLTSAGTLYSLTARLQHAQEHETTVSAGAHQPRDEHSAR